MLKNFKPPKAIAASTAYSVHSILTIAVPTTKRPAGMYIPSKYFRDSSDSPILSGFKVAVAASF